MMEGYETFDKPEIIGFRKSLQLSLMLVSSSCLFYDNISLSLSLCCVVNNSPMGRDGCILVGRGKR